MSPTPDAWASSNLSLRPASLKRSNGKSSRVLPDICQMAILSSPFCFRSTLSRRIGLMKVTGDENVDKQKKFGKTPQSDIDEN
jgi:hypothetical protein